VAESIRTEQDRRISELESLVAGLSAEITRLIELVEKCETRMTNVVLTLESLARRLKTP
jgi:hypothetical protein